MTTLYELHILPSRKMEGSYNLVGGSFHYEWFYHLGKWKGAITAPLPQRLTFRILPSRKMEGSYNLRPRLCAPSKILPSRKMEGSYNVLFCRTYSPHILPSRKMEGSYNQAADYESKTSFYHLGKWKGAITLRSTSSASLDSTISENGREL